MNKRSSLGQPIDWITERFIVVDAWQRVATVLRLLQRAKVTWIVIWRRHPDGVPFWYVLKAKEFRAQVQEHDHSQTIEIALNLREHLGSVLIEDRKQHSIARPIKSFALESPNRVVLIDSKTGKVKSIGQITRLKPARRVTRKPSRPFFLPYLEAAADRSFHPSRIRRKGASVRFHVAKKAAKKKVSWAKRIVGPHVTRQTTKQFEVVPVFFATDRAISKSTADYCTFANRRCDDNQLKYGTCEISIPKKHKKGELESPSWFKLEFFKDPEKHVVLLSARSMPKTKFFASARKSVAASPENSAFVFIHGYNVTFEDAALRTGQIAYDLQFKGAPILFSWPSTAKEIRYSADEATIDVSAEHLRTFLHDVATKTGVSVLHVIAHSMGNRALLEALEKLSASRKRPAIHHVVLAAPDIDAQRFEQIADSINRYPSRITMYASSKDRAIWLSKKFHSFSRAGEAGKNIVVTRGVDTVDATIVDTSMFGLGHSYFATKRTVLGDIFELINKNTPPNKRFGLRQKTHQKGPYWEFVP